MSPPWWKLFYWTFINTKKPLILELLHLPLYKSNFPYKYEVTFSCLNMISGRQSLSSIKVFHKWVNSVLSLAHISKSIMSIKRNLNLKTIEIKSLAIMSEEHFTQAFLLDNIEPCFLILHWKLKSWILDCCTDLLGIWS